MDNLQDFLTLAATVVKYFCFVYLAVTFMVYSLKLPTTARQPRSASVTHSAWERSVDQGVSLAGMAG